MTPPFEIRPAGLEDADELAETVRLGFESYRAWAEPGWQPLPPMVEAARIRDRLREPGVWGVVALDAARHAGHVAFVPARQRDEPGAALVGLGHLWMLFVRPPWWGSGLAGQLHDLAIAEATRRGYEAMRLFTPAGQLRARAFYERRGWEIDGPAFPEPMIGLDLVEYRRALPRD